MKIDHHWDNPWQAEIVNVPVEEFAQLVARSTGPADTLPARADALLARWRVHGPVLDAYVFRKQSLGRYSIGLRYGNEGSQYLSPYTPFNDEVEKLIEKYGTSST